MTFAPDTNARLQREQEFHDERFSDDSARDATKKYYEAVAEGPSFYLSRLHELSEPGSAVLEYGCGIGSSAFSLAQNGANVTGIDISPVAIATADNEAQLLGCAANTTFVVADAEDTGLPDASFDLICGSGILHHLDLAASTAELHRLLKPGGTAVFVEPLGHNRLINWYRDRTPDMRSVDEHPLLDTDLERMAASFAVITHAFGLASIASAWLQRVPLVGAPLCGVLSVLDRALLRIGPLKKYAWLIVLELRPMK